MTAWPALAWEQHPWKIASEPGLSSRGALRKHQGPYEAAVPAYISAIPSSLTDQVVAASADAANEIARFDAELGGEIAPFSAVLLRSESAASSKIEKLTASARAIGEAELGEKTGPNAREVVGNVAAMRAALELAEDLSGDAILTMHRALLEHVDPEIAGQWRHQQVWIGGSGLGPHSATFVPPHHDRVPGLIDDLVAFMARTDIPVLTHVALAHAQFETIHPFPDGNGRTGRALMHAMLRSSGLVRKVTVPVSAGLLADVEGYFAALTAYRQGEPAPIVERVTEAAYEAVNNGRKLVEELRAIRGGWTTSVKARKDAAAWRAADLLLRSPVINVALVANELGIAPQNVYRTLEPLVSADVLRTSSRQRDRVWHAPEVLAAVDAFAKRAGKRQRGRV